MRGTQELNVLTAATIDFANHLREVTKGWRIDPLVQVEDSKSIHNDHVAFVRPPAGVSHTGFFIDNQPQESEFSTLLIKVPSEVFLRMIQCQLIMDSTKPKLLLQYYRAHGFRLEQRSTGYRGSKCPDFDYTKHVVYRTWKIERLTKGSKNRGKRRKRKPSIIHRDRIDIAVPESAAKYAQIAAATLRQSFDKTLRIDQRGERYHNRMAVVIDGKNFTYGDEHHILADYEYE